MNLENLNPGLVVMGIDPDGPATIIAIDHDSPGYAVVSFRNAHGSIIEVVVDGDDAALMSPVASTGRWTFNADGGDFRLGVEAHRIRQASLFDPMAAVNSSEVKPLPHQIHAVYSEMLEQPGPLRFLLADDPGAGKTIMAGLYIKELLIRGDLARCLIVAPGGLVEQWQDELAQKFGLEFRILTPAMIDESSTGNPFDAEPLLIARMDQLARHEQLFAAARESEWDLVVVDEAHRMSAHYFGGELKKTRRYDLGAMLRDRTRHFLLMTATPHAGKEEDFQLFLALLDPDRFEGRYREGAHSRDTSGVMRRMVKEDLLTFEGKPLFTERLAQTVPYTLSEPEMALYEAVTDYVRTEMGRADRLRAAGDGRRSTTVGFALTVLQRRLASSSQAIWRSLQRRIARLEARRTDMQESQVQLAIEQSRFSATISGFSGLIEASRLQGTSTLDVDLEAELDAAELESIEDEIVDAATAASTIAELNAELAVLQGLERQASEVCAAGEDRKWVELRRVLLDVGEKDGVPRKLIVFTEHRDTLNYLRTKIESLLGDHQAVEVIHGGTNRRDRLRVRDVFANDPRCRILLATDAAGEGLNLQCAHLMVNYDLPWNPNRIEQRFGRIHRIGQQEVCRLWNLVASETREGQVFQRLLDKIEEQRKAYGGRVFDVLGEHAFEDTPLRSLLLEAIQYGEQPNVRDRLNQVIDASVANGLAETMRERALASTDVTLGNLSEMRRQMDEAQARKLQPHYVEAFFVEAFTALGGRIARRESGRFEVTHVPASLRNRSARDVAIHGPSDAAGRRSVAPRYARLTCDPARMHPTGLLPAELLAPGHPLIEATIDATIERTASAIQAGSTLVSPSPEQTEPEMIVGMLEEIVDGTGAVLSRRFQYVTFTDGEGRAANAGAAPHRDVSTIEQIRTFHKVDESDFPARIQTELNARQLGSDLESRAQRWALSESLPQHKAEVTSRVVPILEKTRRLVNSRLLAQMNYWDAEAARLADDQAAGKKVRISPATASERASTLELRRVSRLSQLSREERFVVRPPRIQTAWLVVPQSWVIGDFPDDVSPQVPPGHAVDTVTSDLRAVAAVLAAERALGRVPEEKPHNNKGFDIESCTPDGDWIHIEVKGRILGAQDFEVTTSEVIHAKNLGAGKHRLALVSVHPDGAAFDELRYAVDPFAGVDVNLLTTGAVRMRWKPIWEAGTAPR